MEYRDSDLAEVLSFLGATDNYGQYLQIFRCGTCLNVKFLGKWLKISSIRSVDVPDKVSEYILKWLRNPIDICLTVSEI